MSEAFNDLLSEEEKQDAQDRAFLIDIIFQIRDYARKNNMDEDETIKTIAENMLSLLKIATFKAEEQA